MLLQNQGYTAGKLSLKMEKKIGRTSTFDRLFEAIGDATFAIEPCKGAFDDPGARGAARSTWQYRIS
jgi:hypothetical protein